MEAVEDETVEGEAVDGDAARKQQFRMRGNWTTRATGKPTSVVQTLFNRQLGLPHFSRHGDVTDCVSVRQIFERRNIKDEKENSVKAKKVDLKPVKPIKVDLTPGKSVHSGNRGGSTWTQISVPDKTEVSIIDSKIWVRWKVQNPRPRPDDLPMEALYLVEPSPLHGLKFTQRVFSAGNGKMKAKNVFGSRRLSNKTSTVYFLTLIKPGILRAYNLVKKEITQDLALPLSISPGIKEYTDLVIFDECQKIFLMGTLKNLTKVIIILNYPPWREIAIIHVDIPVKISIQDGVCFLFKEKEKCMEITTWPFLQKTAKVQLTRRVIIDDPNPENQVICTSEGRLKEFPTILCKVRAQTEYFGVIDSMSIPLFFGAGKNGMNFYEYHQDPPPVYEFVGMDQEEPIEVFPFPGPTCRALMCSHFSGQSQIVEFKSEWNGRKNKKFLKVTPLDEAFNYWEKARAAADAIPSTSTVVVERRPRRSCVNNNKVSNEQSSKIPVLGIAYCSVMDYLAVLTAGEETFQVAIYDTLKLQAIKGQGPKQEELSPAPVKAWPRVKDDVNPKRSSIESVEFAFEAEFIFVAFQYSGSCKPQREVYYIRLLNEKLLV